MKREKKVIKIRGKDVTIEKRTLDDGTERYYRSGKRVRTQYQMRLAKGVFSGLTPRQAVGKGNTDFRDNFAPKVLTRQELETTREGARSSTGQHVPLERWGATFGSHKTGRSSYYADIRVTEESMKQVGSDPRDVDGDACTVATLQLVRIKGSELQKTFTAQEIRYNFRAIIEDTLRKYRLTLCTGNLEDDLLRFWRHSEK